MGLPQKWRDIDKAVKRERQALDEDDARALAQSPRGVELPAFPPLGGHRGALYCGDLLRILREASNNVTIRAIYNSRSVDWAGAEEYEWTLYVGDPNPRKLKQRIWEGAICNIKRGMIPEWTLTDNVDDPETEIWCWGWRLVVLRCLSAKIIRPSKAILGLLGESDYWRYLNPHAA